MKDSEISVVYGMYNLCEERDMAKHSLGYILEDFADIKKRYVSLGFHLDEFKRCQYYKDFGYLTFEEFCSKNIPLDKGSISRCICVFQQFAAVDKSSGYVSRKMWLDDKYINHSYSQLVEMVPLPSPVQRLITPDMSVTKIREIKKYAKQFKCYDDFTVGKIRNFINNGCVSDPEEMTPSCDVATNEPGLLESEDVPLFSSEQFDSDEFLLELFSRVRSVLESLSLDLHTFEHKTKQLFFEDLDGNKYSIVFQTHKNKK